jgi:eukaryotic-like serine/threonine-protein kinase
VSQRPGSRLGPYEIVSLLGVGGMGEVYRARDSRLDRTVAIKILPADVAADPRRRERFRREARTISSLTHPHVCALHDIGEHDGVDFLVLEYLSGETLADRLRRGPLKFDAALKIALEIADALDKAHHLGIVHRDLKPANVMLTDDGAKLLDFGLAALRQSSPAISSLSTAATDAALPLTGEGTILGTLHYMSPEQLQGKDADPRSDIWAFGCLVYEMFTGRKAFQGDSQPHVIGAIVNSDPPAVSERQPLASPAVDRVVAKCLSKEPDQRWQSAGDLRDVLRLVGPIAPQPIGARRRRAPVREWVAWITAAGAAIALASILAFSQLFGPRPAGAREEMRFQIIAAPAVDIYSIALSPDGRNLAFVASEGAKTQLWLRNLGSTAVKPLGGTDGASFPFWSPDSQSVGFFSDGKLKRVDIGGERVHTLADAFQGRGGTWNRDGVIVFATSTTSPLYRIPAAGGQPAPLTHLDPQVGGHRFPQFLPDGRHLLFFAFSGSPDKQGVYLATLEPPATRRLFYADRAAAFVPPQLLIFAREHVLLALRFDATTLQTIGEPFPLNEPIAESAFSSLAVSAAQTGLLAYGDSASAERPELTWFERSGKRLGPAGNSGAAGRNPELSRDGVWVAFERDVDARSEIWLMDSVRRAPSRLTYDGGAAPVWSPDGNRIVHSHVTTIYWDLYVKLSRGTSPSQLLLKSDTQKYPTDWSLDGRFILYNNIDPTSGYDIWVLPLEGDRKPFPVANTRFEERQGQFAPNARSVAYQSNETGRFEIYVQPFPGPGPKLPVSTEGGVQPRWRRDGRELVYLAPDGTLMSAAVESSSDDGKLEFRRPKPLFQTRIAEGSTSRLAGSSRSAYAATGDGARFLINVNNTQSGGAPITVVVNWAHGLK